MSERESVTPRGQETGKDRQIKLNEAATIAFEFIFLDSSSPYSKTVGAIAQTPFACGTEPITAERAEGLIGTLNLFGLCALRGEMAEMSVWTETPGEE